MLIVHRLEMLVGAQSKFSLYVSVCRCMLNIPTVMLLDSAVTLIDHTNKYLLG